MHTCIVLNILNAFVATSTCPHIFVVICVRDQAGPCGFVTFVEEGVDGETLQLLAKYGTIEQYKACGLRTVKQQMQLRRLHHTDEREGTSSLESSESEMSTRQVDRKFTLKELETLSPEDRRIYLMM